MSNRARVGVVVIAVVVVAVAFVALRPSDSSKKADDTADKTAQTDTTKGGGSPTATAPSAPAPPHEITLKGGTPVGGIKSIKVQKGDVVRLQVITDEPTDQLHLHGYDIEKTAAKGKPANFKFKANIEGVFEIESHTAEHAGREPLIGRLVVEPS